jgi:hypothetical protein
VVRIDGHVRELIAGGVATIVASRDERLRPSIARGWAVAVSASGTEVTLCVEASAGSRMCENLQSNGAIAVTCSRPTTYRTVQLKGRVATIADPSPEQLVAVDRHAETFSREAEEVGLGPGSGFRLLDRGLVSVSFTVAEVYDQTPGPNAGARM